MPNSTAPIMTDATGQKILSTLETVAIGSGNIVDNLNTQDAAKALSANMGKQIGDSISGIRNGETPFQSILFTQGNEAWTISIVDGDDGKDIKFTHVENS